MTIVTAMKFKDEVLGALQERFPEGLPCGVTLHDCMRLTLTGFTDPVVWNGTRDVLRQRFRCDVGGSFTFGKGGELEMNPHQYYLLERNAVY